MLQKVAPVGPVRTYDRTHLPLYAALLEADSAGRPWHEAAATILRIDIADDGAENCWRTHLERARWIIGEGLTGAIEAFNERITR